MSEPIAGSEARQILEVLKELQGDMKGMQSDIQALTIEVKVTQAQVKALDDKVDGLRSELRDDIAELLAQQKTTNARLWGFIVGLVTLIGGSVLKVFWFDRG
ncbi:hemagglutinin [Candidatus Synechococcus calcipolaris G9]|uniref:Hemagglutinin n=1 Tax=Candidatus Synechococcus calcipolaris G9 TaxID=1497997 RepID=A0ABT6F1Z5_9SYNE|nr:hemagglutinin [Candidatus Synechococcus calcipolaris]MDG2991885.1 hemagglutinin [Candidatus Synechococcus calcipolaris G9]